MERKIHGHAVLNQEHNYYCLVCMLLIKYTIMLPYRGICVYYSYFASTMS
jgi:hypothetical protein